MKPLSVSTHDNLAEVTANDFGYLLCVSASARRQPVSAKKSALMPELCRSLPVLPVAHLTVARSGRARSRANVLVSRVLLAMLLLGLSCAESLARPRFITAPPPSRNLAVTASAESAVATPVASAVRIETQGNITRLVFDISSSIAGFATPLNQPDRIIVDLPEVNFQIDPEVGRPKPPTLGKAKRKHGRRGAKSVPDQTNAEEPGLDGLVKSFRFGLFAAGKSRIVIDLTDSARVVRAASQTDAAGQTRFVIELERMERSGFNALVERAARLVVPTQVPTADIAPREPEQAGAKPLVVIDAGHGGVDTGALGAPGVVEKDITFAFATELKEKLDATGQVRTLLTRPTDVFVPLGERVQIARKAGAALFLSIHADTLADATSVSGATVYTVSEKASDSEAARVADSENQADVAAGLDKAEDSNDVNDILADLTRRETRTYSHLMARSIVTYWKGIGKLNKNPQRSAGFVVLKAPDVPSVLLELGYVSNSQDAKSLTSPEWREKAVASVEKSIGLFFASRQGRTEAPPVDHASERASDLATSPSPVEATAGPSANLGLKP